MEVNLFQVSLYNASMEFLMKFNLLQEMIIKRKKNQMKLKKRTKLKKDKVFLQSVMIMQIKNI